MREIYSKLTVETPERRLSMRRCSTFSPQTFIMIYKRNLCEIFSHDFTMHNWCYEGLFEIFQKRYVTRQHLLAKLTMETLEQ